MKKIVLIIAALVTCSIAFSQVTVVQGVGNCITNGNPNLAAQLVQRDISRQCTDCTDSSTGLKYVYVPTEPLGSRWVLAPNATTDQGIIAVYANAAALPTTGDTRVLYILQDNGGGTPGTRYWNGSAYVDADLDSDGGIYGADGSTPGNRNITLGGELKFIQTDGYFQIRDDSQVLEFSNTTNTSGLSIDLLNEANITVTSAHNLVLGTNNSDRVTIEHTTGHVGVGVTNPVERLQSSEGIKIGTAAQATAGTVQWNGSNFQGHNGTAWVDLDQAASASAYSTDLISVGNTTGVFTYAGTVPTYTQSTSLGTITVASGSDLRHFVLNVLESDLGTSTFFDLKIVTTGDNINEGTVASMKIPVLQFYKRDNGSVDPPTSGAPFVNTADTAPRPQMRVVGYGSDSVTIRFLNTDSFANFTIVGSF